MMSYVSSITVTQNDKKYDLEFKIEDVEGSPVDLTGATAVKVFIAEPGASKAKVAGDCVVTNATQGECKYTVQEGDFDEAPKYYQVEVEITYIDGKVVTAKGVLIHVTPELPETT